MDQQNILSQSQDYFGETGPSDIKADSPRCIDNRYIVDHCIGHSKTGSLYLARDQLSNNQLIALKHFDKVLLAPDTLKVIRQELTILKRLKHPNIARVYDFGVDPGHNNLPGSYYLTREYVEGESLNSRTPEKSKKYEQEIFSFTIQICRALNFIHSRDLIHRNITGQNILVTNKNAVILTDFGLGDYEMLTPNKDVSPRFIAPEVSRGECGRQSDIFSIGLVLFQLITGESFYRGCPLEKILTLLQDQQLFDDFKKARMKSCINSTLYSLIKTMISFDLDTRYQSGFGIISVINKCTGKKYSLETRKTQRAYTLGSAFIGREDELQHLIQFAQKADNKNILWVQGSTGVGKSRLLMEFKTFCQFNDIFFFEGTCSQDIHYHFYPFLSILKEVLLNATETIIQQYGPELKKIMPEFEGFRNLQVNPTQDPQTERIILIRNISECLIKTANSQEKKWIIYINDAQWIDEASLDLIVKLQSFLSTHENESQLCLMMTSRMQDTQVLVDALPNQHIEKLDLNPFHQDQVKEYFTTLFGRDTLGTKLNNAIPSIHKKTGGNPFILNEYVKLMIEDKAVVRQDRNWELVIPVDEIDIPQNLEHLITSNLDRLSITNNERTALMVLALLNRLVSWEELVAIVQVEQSFLISMVHQEIIIKAQSTLGTHYRLAHDLLRDTIISQILVPASIHKRIAEGLEQIVHDEIDLYIEDLAFHYFHAKVKEKALYYLEKAGLKAMTNWEVKKAVDVYDQMLTLLQHDNRENTIDILYNKGIILYNVSRLHEACELFNQAKRLSVKIHDKHRQALNNVYRGLCLVAIGYSFEDCLQCYKETLALFKEINDKEGLSSAYHSLGYLYFFLKRNNEKALEYLHRGLSIGEEIGDPRCLARNQSELAQVYHSQGDFGQAIDYARKALKNFQIRDDKRDIAASHGFLGFFYTSKADYTQALYHLNIEIGLAEELENFSFLIGGLIKKSEVMYRLGDLSEARKYCDQAINLLPRGAEYEFIFMSKVLSAKINFARGRKKNAISELLALEKDTRNTFEVAKLNFELWQMTLEDKYKENSLRLYRDIVKESSDYRYLKRLEAMENDYLLDNQFYPDHKEYREKTESAFDQEKPLEQGSSAIVSECIIPADPFFHEMLESISDLNSDLQLSVVLDKIINICINMVQADQGAILLLDSKQELKVKAVRNKNSQPIGYINVPKAVKAKILEDRQPLFIVDTLTKDKLQVSKSIADMNLRSIMCAPLVRKCLRDNITAPERVDLLGMIYLHSTISPGKVQLNQGKLQILQAFADQACVALYNAMLREKLRESNDELEKMARERTADLTEANKQLHGNKEKIIALNQQLKEKVLNWAAKLKHAESEISNHEQRQELTNITTATLHNIKNLLNSINVSSEFAYRICSSQTMKGLHQANELLKSKIGSLYDYVTNDTSARQLMEYYLLLEEQLVSEIGETKKHFKRLNDKIRLVNEIISAQPEYGNYSKIEEINVEDLVTNTLVILSASLEQRNIKVIKDFCYIPPIKNYKLHLLHILINLIKNACESMSFSNKGLNQLEISFGFNEGYVYVAIKDTGHGISQEDLTRIKNYGFTTKKEGHGFGLYSCVRYLQEMKGSLDIYSKGVGKGATATIQLPISF